MKITCFKRFMANTNLVKGTTLTVEKKTSSPSPSGPSEQIRKKNFLVLLISYSVDSAMSPLMVNV